MGKDLKGKELGKGISQRKDGRYVARFTSVAGKPIEKYFHKRFEAQQWIDEAKYADRHGNISAASEMSLDAWFWYWLDNIKGDTIRDGTKTVYKNRYRSRIKGLIGDMVLSEIKPLHCQNILIRSNEAGESYDSNKKLRSILFSIFKAAVENDLIVKNPVTSSVKCLGEKSKERRVFTALEQNRFLEESRRSAHYNVFAFVLQTGLRGGELSGLKWADVDWTRRTITIKRSLEFKNGRFIDNPPKTRESNRTIPLTDEAYRILMSQKAKEADRIVSRIEYHDYIFLNHNGKPNHRHIYNRAIKTIGAKIGIDGLSMHCLRHTFATRAIESGIKPKTLQKLLGHSTIDMTMNLYVHTTNDFLFDEMKKFPSLETIEKEQKVV